MAVGRAACFLSYCNTAIRLNQMIHKFTEQQAREFIYEQHAIYYNRLATFLAGYDVVVPAMPTASITDAVYTHCGQYTPSLHQCQYSLPYCVFDGANYFATVAHEVSHSFQYALNQNAASHGREFLWLIAECGLPNPKQQIYHSYPVAVVCRIADELKAMRGGVSDDISFTTRRKSLKELMQERARR